MAKKGKDQSSGRKILARNKRAGYDYNIHERLEAGIVLTGSEVKSLRDAKVSIAEGFVEFRGQEAWLVNVQIEEYKWANVHNHEPKRRRKLLLHKKEIAKLSHRVEIRGQSLIPTCIYLKDGKIKVEIATVTGKKNYEKRDSKRKEEAKRDIDRALARRDKSRS